MMSLTSTERLADATRYTADVTPAPSVGVRRSRRPGVVLLGAFLVLAGAVSFYATSVRVGPRVAVLALARGVEVGHVLTEADLVAVRIVPAPALGAVPDAQRSTVVGRSVRQPLAAHTLLSQSMLGPASWPPAGRALIAVAVKSGHAPTTLGAGAEVLVIVVPSVVGTAVTTASSAFPAQASAAVVSVATTEVAGAMVASLLVAPADAVRIVTAPGDVSLVEMGR